MRHKKQLEGLIKKDTYDGLVNYLDVGQERIKYPNRLATQLRNSHEILNLLDSEGRGWLEENKKQMSNFTAQPVREILMKQNLQPQQTYQQEYVLNKPRNKPQVFDMAGLDLDEKMAQQQDDILAQYTFEDQQVQDRRQEVAPRFIESLGQQYPTWADTYIARRNTIGGSSSSASTTLPSSASEVSKVAQSIVKHKVGRPTTASIKAQVEARAKAIAEVRADAMVIEEARAKASYDSQSDEDMRRSTNTKRGGSDNETPQKGHRRKKTKGNKGKDTGATRTINR